METNLHIVLNYLFHFVGIENAKDYFDRRTNRMASLLKFEALMSCMVSFMLTIIYFNIHGGICKKNVEIISSSFTLNMIDNLG